MRLSTHCACLSLSRTTGLWTFYTTSGPVRPTHLMGTTRLCFCPINEYIAWKGVDPTCLQCAVPQHRTHRVLCVTGLPRRGEPRVCMRSSTSHCTALNSGILWSERQVCAGKNEAAAADTRLLHESPDDYITLGLVHSAPSWPMYPFLSC